MDDREIMNKPAKMLELAWLPNREGFQFIGVLKDGSTRECVVIRRENGTHTVEGYSELVGWFHKS